MRSILALAAVAVIATAIALSSQSSIRRAPTSPPATATATGTAAAAPAATRTPAPPRLDRVAINRQDRVTERHRARESRAFDGRALLARLPLTRAGVRIDIAGLAPDDRTTVLAIDPGQRSRAHARAIYRRALRRSRDSGDAYVLEWAR